MIGVSIIIMSTNNIHFLLLGKEISFTIDSMKRPQISPLQLARVPEQSHGTEGKKKLFLPLCKFHQTVFQKLKTSVWYLGSSGSSRMCSCLGTGTGHHVLFRVLCGTCQIMALIRSSSGPAQPGKQLPGSWSVESVRSSTECSWHRKWPWLY